MNEDELFEVGEEEAEEVGGDGSRRCVATLYISCWRSNGSTLECSKHDLQVTHVVALRVTQLTLQ